MSIGTWMRTERIRRGVAASAIVLAAGGLVLFRSSASARPVVPSPGAIAHVGGGNSVTFAAPGAHGTIALSHRNVNGGQNHALYADVHLIADKAEHAETRAPLSIAVVIDTSGSMSGEKMDQAKDSIARLVREMRDDDQIAVVRYSDTSETIQTLARVGEVRGSLLGKISRLEAGGGTAIPRGLEAGMATLDEAAVGRVRRVVLVSDGLDGTRAEAERLAKTSASRGVTISSLGIGLDFDESYMGSIARVGQGNFGFVRDGAALAMFLRRELVETAATTIENATVRVTLPANVRFVRASGADVRLTTSDQVELKIGSLFAGDERRVVMELATSLEPGETRALTAQATWVRVGGAAATANAPELTVVATNDTAAVERTQDTSVVASWTSVTASERQLEAAEAYAHGDTKKADDLIGQNVTALRAAQAIAPAAMATALASQAASYGSTRSAFAAAPPASTAGKVAAKRSAEKDSSHLSLLAY